MKLNKSLLLKWCFPVIILAIVCTLTIGSSPLFVTNPWVDTNAMLTMGKAMLHGLVPYRDIIDQRGPLLYALFALGASYKETNFSGVFFLQIINVFLTYWLSWRILVDQKKHLLSPQWTALLGPLALLGTSAFSLSGSPEEFAFTSVLYLLYVVNHYQQKITEIPLKTFFFLGLNLSLIFWNKYSLIGAFVVFFIWTAVVFIRQKDFKKLLKIFIASALGFFSITILIMLYFAFNHALSDMFNIYFMQNFNSYGHTRETSLMLLWRLLFLVVQELQLHLVAVVIIILSWLKALYHKQDVILEMALFLGTIVFVALQHRVPDYYNLIWMPFLAVALLRLTDVDLKIKFDQKITVTSLKLLLTATLILMPFINNKILNQLIIRNAGISYNGNRYQAQTHFAKIMNETTAPKRPTLLVPNDLDEGFYLAANTLPTTRYWQKLNMNYQQLPQMYQNFQYYLNHKQVDFVVISLSVVPDPNRTVFKQQIKAALDSHLYQPLMKNYRIRAIDNNSTYGYFVLFQKK